MLFATLHSSKTTTRPKSFSFEVQYMYYALLLFPAAAVWRMYP